MREEEVKRKEQLMDDKIKETNAFITDLMKQNLHHSQIQRTYYH